MAQLKACGVLVFRDEPDESFLLMRHHDRYDLPKGHLDEGESERECALRELAEETGIPAEAVQLDPRFRFTTSYTVRSKRHGGQEREKTVVIFLGWLSEPVEITPTEHRSYEWVTWRPPHQIQTKTIDPLLAKVAEYRAANDSRAAESL